MKYRAIVFEDDENCRQLLCLILQQRGYEVISSADPSLCPVYLTPHETCSNQHACGDFLLTDQRMPHISGLDFIANQQQRGCKGTLLHKAVISGSWTPAERAQAKQLGCKVFTKPYKAKDINTWLDGLEPLIDPQRQLTQLSSK